MRAELEAAVFPPASPDVDRLIDLPPGFPAGLRGTFLRMAAGRVIQGGLPVHLFDALPYVGSFEVGVRGVPAGKARLRLNHVETPLAKAEGDGPISGRSVFTPLPGGILGNAFRLRVRDPSNHDIAPFAGKWWISGDSGYFPVDPETLAVGPKSKAGAKKGEKNSLMARLDPTTGRRVSFRVQPGARKPDVLTFVELDADGKICHEVRCPLESAGRSFHDLAFTARHYLVIEWASEVSLVRVIAGLGTVYQALQPTAGAPRLWIVPKDGSPARVVPIGDSYRQIFHIANAYDDGDEVVVDVCAWVGLVDFHGLAPKALRDQSYPWPATEVPGQLLRIRVRGGEAALEVLYNELVDSPDVDQLLHGKPYRFGWFWAQGPQRDEAPAWHALVAVDTQTREVQRWDAGDLAIPGPPAFVPRPGAPPEQGWILAWVTRPAEATVAVLDAQALANGPIVEVPLGVALSVPGHTSFEGP